MLHITCDLCRKEIPPDIGQRYIVKIEVFAAQDPAMITEADLDEDHLEAVSEILRESDEVADPNEAAPAYKCIRYDLCPACHQRFLRDPLGRESAAKFHFSKN
jgi:hypothetical protein